MIERVAAKQSGETLFRLIALCPYGVMLEVKTGYSV